MHALTMLVKLSSVKMMSDASFATSVPVMPWKIAHHHSCILFNVEIYRRRSLDWLIDWLTRRTPNDCELPQLIDWLTIRSVFPTIKIVEKWEKWEVSTHHGESHVGFLQGRSVIRSVSRYSNDLPTGPNRTVDDTFDQNVLVLRRGSRENTKSRPDFINQRLSNLQNVFWKNKKKIRKKSVELKRFILKKMIKNCASKMKTDNKNNRLNHSNINLLIE